MYRATRPSLRTSVVALLLFASFVALACGTGEGPPPSAPVAEPPPPPPTPAPAAAEAPANQPAPAAPAGPRDLLDDRERVAPAAEPSEDDLQSAQAELERARVELNRALGSAQARAAGNGSAPGASGGAGRGAPAAAPPAKADKKSEESSCDTACRAFSSLERAAGAVCRITGEKDGRCGHAHAVLAEAQKRVSVCSCSAG